MLDYLFYIEEGVKGYVGPASILVLRINMHLLYRRVSGSKINVK